MEQKKGTVQYQPSNKRVRQETTPAKSDGKGRGKGAGGRGGKNEGGGRSRGGGGARGKGRARDFDGRVVKPLGQQVERLDVHELLNNQPKLLSDEEVQSFIMKGYHILQTDLPHTFHESLFRKIDSMDPQWKKNPGNNILPALPELMEVFDCSAVRGALTSLVGNNYIMHPHRHVHDTRPGSAAQQWHKDSYWGYRKPRHHFPKWVMAMYYPQQTVLNMGPTAVAGFSQYYAMPHEADKRANTLPQEWHAVETPVACKAGTVVIIAYDIWHKATANTSEDKNRYMFKFQFVRMEEPSSPTWNSTSLEWDTPTQSEGAVPYHLLAPVWRSVWRWMCGLPSPAVGVKDEKGAKPSEEIQKLLEELRTPSEDGEPLRLHAAYTLGEMGKISLLGDALLDETDEWVTRNAGFGLIAAGEAAVPFVVNKLKQTNLNEETIAGLLFVAGELGIKAWGAVPAIAGLLGSRNVFIRRVASESLGFTLLGCIGGSEREKKESFALGLDALCSALSKDEDEQVRFQSCLSIAKVGHNIGSLGSSKEKEKEKKGKEGVLNPVAVLTNATRDENRYVRQYALEGLKQIPTEEARRIVLKLLSSSAWCPLTTEASQF